MNKTACAFFAAATLLALGALAQSPPVQILSASGAELRALDKVAGASSDIVLGIGETAQFGRLSITLTECRYPQDNPGGEAFAYLTIEDPNAPGAVVFDGWMIASSPALNALDHARFDVWVLRCNIS